MFEPLLEEEELWKTKMAAVLSPRRKGSGMKIRHGIPGAQCTDKLAFDHPLAPMALFVHTNHNSINMGETVPAWARGC